MGITATPHELKFEAHAGDQVPVVSVVVPLFNYEDHVLSTLDSISLQTFQPIELLVINDGSTDNSEGVVLSWLENHSGRFVNSRLISHTHNAGLPCARNTGAVLARSDQVFFIDADNLIYPDCISTHVTALAQSDAAFAYSILEVFENQQRLMGTATFSRDRLKKANHIDAMALVRRPILDAMGGYKIIKEGWEDYDLWLRFEEAGYHGIHIPEILGRYRVHGNSMLNALTDEELHTLINRFENTFPWLELDKI